MQQGSQVIDELLDLVAKQLAPRIAAELAGPAPKGRQDDEPWRLLDVRGWAGRLAGYANEQNEASSPSSGSTAARSPSKWKTCRRLRKLIESRRRSRRCLQTACRGAANPLLDWAPPSPTGRRTRRSNSDFAT